MSVLGMLEEDDVELSPSLTLEILKRLPIPTLFRICPTIKFGIWKWNELVDSKVNELLQLTCEQPDPSFKRQLYDSLDEDATLVKRILEYSVGILRWNLTNVFVNASVKLPKAPSAFLLCGNGVLRVTVGQESCIYLNGKLDFCTDLQISRTDTIYTSEHILSKVGGEWQLSTHPLTTSGDLVSSLPSFNSVLDGRDIVTAHTTGNNLLVILNDNTFLHYDWFCDEVLLSDKRLVRRMDMITAETTDEGDVVSVWFKDKERRHWCRYDILNDVLVTVDTKKYCTVIIPIFTRGLVWTLDENNVQTVYNMMNGSRVAERPFDQFKVRLASYVSSVEKMIVVDESNSIVVNSVNTSGILEPCGALSNEEQIDYVVAGYEDVVFANDRGFRYVSFAE
jgi:hypothetical protein